ncbi:MAG: ribonuclease E/G, partial [Gammaproteobacteria bacterium]
LQTNLEAVDELARQMRIRDLGGLLVIDLIDMTSIKNKKTVENRLAEAVRTDRARIQIGHISRFGLLEMSRQRMRSSISDSNYGICSLCDGTGQVRHVMSSALSFLRILEEEALKENTEAVFAELPVESATFLLNEKRFEVNQIENKLGTRIVLIPSPELHGSQFNIQRLRSEDLDSAENTLASHKIKIVSDEDRRGEYTMKRGSRKPAVSLDQIVTAAPPAPTAPAPVSEVGFFSRLIKKLSGDEPKEKNDSDKSESRAKTGQGRSRGGRGRNRRDSSRSGNRGSQSGNRTRQGESRDAAKSKDGNTSPSDAAPRGNQRRSRGGRGRSNNQGNRNNASRGNSAASADRSDQNQRAPSEGAEGKTGTAG